MDIVKALSLAGSVSVLLLVIELIRRGRLKERYALLWLFSGVIMFLLSLSRGLLEFFAHLVGIYYPPSLLFLVAFIFLLLITLHFSSVISGLSEKNKLLTQEIGLLRQELDELRRGDRTQGAGRLPG